MSFTTRLPYADSTVSPIAGCTIACELWPSPEYLTQIIHSYLVNDLGTPPDQANRILQGLFASASRHPLTASAFYVDRKHLLEEVLYRSNVDLEEIREHLSRLTSLIEEPFKCYAGHLHLRHAAKLPEMSYDAAKGYAPCFHKPAFIPERMMEAAGCSSLRGKNRSLKPWLNHSRRIIALGDMGDLFSPEVPLEFHEEVIHPVVTSEKGRRHLWLLSTRSPQRMLEFSNDLTNRGLHWPENLIAATSVTMQEATFRIDQLKQIPSTFKAVLAQPLWEPIHYDFTNIDWLIVGGEAARHAQRFDLQWARHLKAQCDKAGTAFFMSQAGSNTTDHGEPVSPIKGDPYGMAWELWSEDLRIRNLPPEFYHIP